MRRTPKEVVADAPSEDQDGEPVIAQLSCDGRATLTRFRTTELTATGAATDNPAPADRGGHVIAVAASATNDAWAVTSGGAFASGAPAPPRLYHLMNIEPPKAERGNSQESSTEQPPPAGPSEEPAPPPPPAPATKITTTKRTIKLAPALYDVKSKLHTSTVAGRVALELYITFKLRRATTIGAHALRGGRVVSVARPKHFKGHSGTLILSLDRAHWPTKVTFVS
jgi:hypothetical protein